MLVSRYLLEIDNEIFQNRKSTTRVKLAAVVTKCGFYNYWELPLFFIYKTGKTIHKTALSIWFGQSSVNICKWQPPLYKINRINSHLENLCDKYHPFADKLYVILKTTPALSTSISFTASGSSASGGVTATMKIAHDGTRVIAPASRYPITATQLLSGKPI